MGGITLMATNNFKAFALDPNANVMSQADWEALPALLSGFISGPAKSAQVNKAIRQASFIAAALAQYTANKSGLDVLDNGDLNGFITKMTTAFGKDFQALDATLTALAGLATGANKLPYFTGADTASQTDLTSVGRDIIGKSTIADILTYLGLANGSGYVGRLLGVRVITTSGTYTPTAGTKSIVVEVQGGGGGGGGGAISGTGASAGGGGTSGCYAKSFLTTLNSSYPVTIGAGGNGAAGNQVGGGGGKTSFGIVVTADGGYGGDTMVATGSTPMIVSASSGSQPSQPVATGGNIININIQQQPTQAFRLSALIACSGCGGASPFGQGGGNSSTSNNGAPSPSYGGGGGGAIAIGVSAASFTGGNGGSGVVIVWEYA